MNLRAWFSEYYGGIKEGLAKRSFVAMVLHSLDRKAGLRGAFGRRRKPFPIDRTTPHNAARGPRPITWWKLRRGPTGITGVQGPTGTPLLSTEEIGNK
jgi:hypothetical protein